MASKRRPSAADELPESSLRESFRRRMPKASDVEIDSASSYMKSELAADPYALQQTLEPGEAGAQYLYIKGYGLEAAMYLAALTYTDVEAHWQQLHPIRAIPSLRRQSQFPETPLSVGPPPRRR
jgi:hypothetical protein